MGYARLVGNFFSGFTSVGLGVGLSPGFHWLHGSQIGRVWIPDLYYALDPFQVAEKEIGFGSH
jgi:hypothetical protein